MPHKKNKGAILFLVLGTIIVVFLLCGAMLAIISNQSRLTHHQVSRIRAYYAAKAGMVAAFECLRKGVCVPDPNASKYFCINGPVPSNSVCDWTLSDPDFSNNIEVRFCPSTTEPGLNNTVKLEVVTNYTPSP